MLSNGDLKNLNLLSREFPEYIGDRRKANTSSVSKENELVTEATNAYESKEAGFFTSPKVGEDSLDEFEDDIRVKQDESSVQLEYPEDMRPTK